MAVVLLSFVVFSGVRESSWENQQQRTSTFTITVVASRSGQNLFSIVAGFDRGSYQLQRAVFDSGALILEN